MKSALLILLVLSYSVTSRAQTEFIKKTVTINDANLAKDIQSLVDSANANKLSEQRTWRKLMHYELNAFGRLVSQVKDPKFFLSENGHRNLNAELQATLWSYYAPADLKDEHAICKFPARLSWLKSKLLNHPAWTQLPQPNCY